MSKFFSKIYLHVGGKDERTYNDRDIIQYDRTADASMIAFNQREERPLYEVKSRHHVTMDILPTIQQARKLRDRGGDTNGRYINEIAPGTGLKRRVA